MQNLSVHYSVLKADYTVKSRFDWFCAKGG